MPIRFGSEPGSLGGADKVYVGSDLVWPSSVLWTPAQFGSSLLVWLDLMDAATLTLSGADRLAAIGNKGALGGALTAQTANLPLYAATGRNGLPAAYNDHFFGDGLSASFGSGLPSGDAPSTMAGVGFMTVNDGAARSFLNWGDTITPSAYRFIAGYFGDLYGDYGASGPVGGDAWVDVDAIMNFGHEPGTNYGARDGVAYSPVSEPSALVTTTAEDFMFLYANEVGGQEAIVLDRLMTADEELKFHGYSAHKWNLTDKLPSGHPYKSAAPTV